MPSLLLLLGLLAGAAPAGGAGEEPLPRAPLVGDLDWLLLASGNEQGWHQPCGCSAVRAGGIARRAGLDARLAEVDPARPRVWVMAGNHSATDDGEPGWARTEALLDWAAGAGVAAVNLGGRELDAGLERSLVELARRRLPAVSSSLVRAGEPERALLDEPVAVRQVPDGPRLAFVGLTAHRPGEILETGQGPAKTRPAAEALADGLRRAQALGAQQVVVLAALPVEELRDLAATAPEVFFVGSEGTHQLQGGNWAYLGSRGKNVLETGFGASGPVLRYHVLDQYRPEDPELLELQRQAGLRVNALRRAAAAERLAEAPASREPSAWTGTGSCRACHVLEYLAWERHGHSRALESLEAAAADFDPDCLACHATAFGRPGGFRSSLESPELGQVGCESCHGAGGDHVRSGGREPLGEVPAGTCLACHDEANSPGFDRESAWQRIRHGPERP